MDRRKSSDCGPVPRLVLLPSPSARRLGARNPNQRSPGPRSPAARSPCPHSRRSSGVVSSSSLTSLLKRGVQTDPHETPDYHETAEYDEEFFQHTVLGRIHAFRAAASGPEAYEAKVKRIDAQFEREMRNARDISQRRQLLDSGGATWEVAGFFTRAQLILTAAAAGHLWRVRELVRTGCAINACDQAGRSVLMLAASGGQKQLPPPPRNRVAAVAAAMALARAANTNVVTVISPEGGMEQSSKDEFVDAAGELPNPNLHDIANTSASANAVTDVDANTRAEASAVANDNMAEASEHTSTSCVETLKGSATPLPDSTPLAIAQRARMRAFGEVTPRTKMRREAAQKRAEARARDAADAEARYDAKVNAAREAIRGVALESQAHVDTVAYLLRACPRKYKKQFIEMRNSSGATALHGACAHGCTASARLLLDECASILVKDNAGRNPVDYAFLYRHDELARELCVAYKSASGLVYNAEGLRDRADVTVPQASIPMQSLASSGEGGLKEVVATTRVALPQVAVSTMRGSALWGEEADNNSAVTGLDMRALRGVEKSEWVCTAADAGDVDQLIRLLGGGFDLSASLTSHRQGANALYLAARGGKAGGSIEMASDCHLAVVRQLLWLCPPECMLEMLNHQRLHKGGYTPLMAAAARGRVKTVRLLLDAGADSSICDHYGATAMDWARSLRRTAVSRLLQSRSPNISSATRSTKHERLRNLDAMKDTQRARLIRAVIAKLPEHEQP